MKTLMKTLLVWMTNRRAYAWLMLKVVPYIRFTTYYTSLRGFKYHKGYAILRPGDFIVTVDKKKLTSLLVPGTWTHAAFCVSKDGVWEVSEMTHENYVKSCFFDICKEADRVAIYRWWNAEQDPGYVLAMAHMCKSFKQAVYNVQFDFNLGIKALYCSELVYQSDFGKQLGFDLTDIVGLGRPYISPDGLTLGKHVNCVWDSDSV